MFSKDSFAQMKRDLADLTSISYMASWQTEYVELNPSQERLAAMVLKLKREVHHIKRPHQLALLEVLVCIGEPVDLSPFITDYIHEPQKTRHRIVESLQSLIDKIARVKKVE